MTAPAPTDRNKSGRLTISGLPTRSNRTFSPGEMAARTFIQHALTNTFSIYKHHTTVATYRCAFNWPSKAYSVNRTPLRHVAVWSFATDPPGPKSTDVRYASNSDRRGSLLTRDVVGADHVAPELNLALEQRVRGLRRFLSGRE